MIIKKRYIAYERAVKHRFSEIEPIKDQSSTPLMLIIGPTGSGKAPLPQIEKLKASQK